MIDVLNGANPSLSRLARFFNLKIYGASTMVNIDWEEYYDQKYDEDKDYELEEQVKLALRGDSYETN